ncbi:MAG: phosphoribosylformylglycinamidine synthase, purS protein [Chloroflexi bacterium 13_1_40CM_4_68_4]|nr:MAG: phosphoribosylformylglycinamidine synthase, purS protein [Chloroflexi bacterium 13_1_40CM_4_68_4]
MKFVATIHVRPRREVRDPQGDAVAGALRSIGLTVEGVRVGKEIVVRFDAASESTAREMTTTMGKELLANPVVEDFTVELRPDS